jgi:hypothetical protein
VANGPRVYASHSHTGNLRLDYTRSSSHQTPPQRRHQPQTKYPKGADLKYSRDNPTRKPRITYTHCPYIPIPPTLESCTTPCTLRSCPLPCLQNAINSGKPLTGDNQKEDTTAVIAVDQRRPPTTTAPVAPTRPQALDNSNNTANPSTELFVIKHQLDNTANPSTVLFSIKHHRHTR